MPSERPSLQTAFFRTQLRRMDFNPPFFHFGLLIGGLKPTLRLQKSRHSRAGGNLGRSVSVMSEFRETDESSFPCRRKSRMRGSGNIQRLSENSEVLDSRFRGNDGGEVSAFPINGRNLKPILPARTEKQKPKIPSSPR
ncbi:hypothetical protein [Neisseria benedictiae]|uniref:hypothetical protein n=1 Tax=Neisseria benedictiae TaxID=2830649 RepID=UPI002659C03F|nr:hypothetical protein [Neisseria benedictiae]